jgi:hypothetical protein
MATVTTHCNTTPPAHLDQPAYHYTGPQSSPRYSDIPDTSECVLESGASYSGDSPVNRTDTHQSVEPDFAYNADHMTVNVGSRMWGLRNPAYGLQGHVEGFVKLLGEQAHVTSVGARVRLPLSADRICSLNLDSPSSYMEILSSGPAILVEWSGRNLFVSFDNPTPYIRLVSRPNPRCPGVENVAFLLNSPPTWT